MEQYNRYLSPQALFRSGNGAFRTSLCARRGPGPQGGLSCADLLPKFCKRLFASPNGPTRIGPKRSLQTEFGEDFHRIGPRITGITNRFEQWDQRNFTVARQIAIAERARCAPIAYVHTKNTAVQLFDLFDRTAII